jgi:hypothetical protein
VKSLLKVMSEFKFACPVCGQHITAGANSVGSKIACPTCFRKIVVPQAPASADPKFILSAAEADKPRPLPTATLPSEPLTPMPRRSFVPMVLILFLIVTGATGTTLFVMRDRIFKSRHGQAEGDADTPSGGGIDAGNNLPAATNTLSWSLDLAEVSYPTDSAAGRIHGRDFVCERAILEGGTLTLRHPFGQTDLGLNIYFFAKQAEELAGKVLAVTTNNSRSPRVVIRWKEGPTGKRETIDNNYALKIEFGAIAANRIPGKIYVCLPDQSQSCVAGTFVAEIRKPPAQRQPVNPRQR